MNLLKKTGALLLSLAMLSSAVAFGASAKATDASSVIKARSVSLHSVRGKDGKLLNKQPVTVYQVATCNVDGTWEWLGDFASAPPVINVNTEDDPVYAKVVFQLSDKKKHVIDASGSFKAVKAAASYTKDDDPGTEIVIGFGSDPADVYYEVLISDIAENRLPNTVMPATGVYQLSKELESRADTALASLGDEVKATGTTAEIDADADEEKSLSNITLPNYLEERTSPKKDLSAIGYYLIVTDTNNDVDVQPTLEAYDVSGYQTSYIVPKSGAVSIGKEITAVSDGEVDTVSGSKQHHTSVSAPDGTVSYKITVRTPKYSPDLFDDSLRNEGETDEAFFARILSSLDTVNTGRKPFQPFTIIDDPADGLDINMSTLNVIIKDLGNNKESQTLVENGASKIGTNLTITEKSTGADANDGFVITFANEWLFANAPEYIYQDKPIEITFNAFITDKAVYGSDPDNNTDVQTQKLVDARTAPSAGLTRNYNDHTGNENTVQALYANDYSTGQGYAESHDTVVTYVAKVSLNKTAQDTGSGLENVEFRLTCTANAVNDTYYTDASGNINFGYLAPGTYTLSEVTPPEGYQAVGDITFTVKAKEDGADTAADPFTTYVINKEMIPSDVTVNGNGTGNVTINVVDQTILSLPGTGGAGTVMFVAGGAVFILASGLVFFGYGRKNRENKIQNR